MAISCIGSLKGRGAIMTPRSLVGMTMGARRRAARAQYMYGAYILRDCRRYVLRLFSETKDGVSSEYKRAWRMYRIGQRLRPCPGCQKCGSVSRRFVQVVGWCRPSDWVLWDGSKLWRGGRGWRRACPITNLRDYIGAAERGTWKELFCDGSGVLPAKGKARR